MLRLNELALPLEHPADALRPAILARLGIPSADLLRFEIYKRGIDARKPYAILFVYTVDVEVRDPDAVLARAKRNAKLGITLIRITSLLRAPQQLQQKRLVRL